jgi:sulfite reductase alpha subunit-like flavoprotein
MAGSDRHAGDRSALVLFGSETGNAQDVAEDVGHICERLRLATLVCDLNSVDIVGPEDLLLYLCLFIVLG